MDNADADIVGASASDPEGAGSPANGAGDAMDNADADIVDASATDPEEAGWISAHPGATVAVAAGLVIFALPGVVAVPVLSAVGFGANGIIAGKALRTPLAYMCDHAS